MSDRSRIVPAVLALLVLLTPWTASAARPEFDRSSLQRPDAGIAASLDRLKTDPVLRRIGTVAHVDDHYGVPTFVWAASTPARATTTVSPSRADDARRFLGTVAPFYGPAAPAVPAA